MALLCVVCAEYSRHTCWRYHVTNDQLMSTDKRHPAVSMVADGISIEKDKKAGFAHDRSTTLQKKCQAWRQHLGSSVGKSSGARGSQHGRAGALRGVAERIHVRGTSTACIVMFVYVCGYER